LPFVDDLIYHYAFKGFRDRCKLLSQTILACEQKDIPTFTSLLQHSVKTTR